jgi:hypothetical protein
LSLLRKRVMGRVMKFPIGLLGAGAFATLTIAGAGSASAQISGTYAFTFTQNCIAVVPPATFNSEFQPTAPPVFSDSANAAGTITFNSNGTGAVNTVLSVSTTTPVLPGTFSSTNSSGQSSKLTFQFNYTVNNGIATLTLASGSFLETILTGSRAGQTATQDVLTLAGYISADGKEILFISDGTQVQTQTYSNGDVVSFVCTDSGRGYTFP